MRVAGAKRPGPLCPSRPKIKAWGPVPLIHGTRVSVEFTYVQGRGYFGAKVYTLALTHAHIYRHTHVHTLACTHHSYTRTPVCSVHAHMNTYAYTFTLMHTYMHAHTHARMHAHTPTCVCKDRAQPGPAPGCAHPAGHSGYFCKLLPASFVSCSALGPERHQAGSLNEMAPKFLKWFNKT